MSEHVPQEGVTDLLIIGGGVNGCGIARDAAGRGLSVTLVEMGDLGGATSSASTKLFHGGLRYLEYGEIRLVREALRERETLLAAMPHISWPLRFVLPLDPQMRFDGTTPVSRLLGVVMPWLRGRRPAWLIRLGLVLYDTLGGRRFLPGTRKLDLTTAPEGKPLKPRFRRAFEYSDGWVQDSRLVVLNARDAAQRGGRIRTRTRVVSALARDGLWEVTLATGEVMRARALVNAAGPWVDAVIGGVLARNDVRNIRLVRGSHIVTRRLFEHDKAYFFQGRDGRIIFAIPYEGEFTLIGTTDAPHDTPDTAPVCTEAERDYLCAFASEYFARPVTADDVVHTFAGVRPLYEDGASSASAATREYVLRLEQQAGAPVLHVFGGKITTYRTLSEAALAKLAPHLPMGQPWTAGVPLPGGDFAVGGAEDLARDLAEDYPFITSDTALRLVRTYGTEARTMLGEARSASDLGEDFGAALTAREVNWLCTHEFATTADDILWRRTKLGLHLGPEAARRIDTYLAAR
ncbi:MAG: glycerol-3-phosphate dehydrogenase [Paracoccaceae bacterium]